MPKTKDVESQFSNEEINNGPEHCTDLGNARRLVRLHGDDLRYSQSDGWLVWDGKRFALDDTGAVERLAKATVMEMYREAADISDNDIRRALIEHARKSEADGKIKAMISLAKTEPSVAIRHSALDRDPWLLNVANGTLDLRTSKLAPHTWNNLITRIIPVDYDPTAQCPIWMSVLDRAMAGDENKVRYLQKCFGYSLTGVDREQCFFILHGSGANAKSTILNTFRSLLNDYARNIGIETITPKRGNQSGGASEDVARLSGSRFVTAIENNANQKLAEGLVKGMTGGDPLTARRLFRPFFEFFPTFKLWLGVNHKPRVTGTDHAIWRRIKLIPFTVTIPDSEQDKELPEKLKAELPGILTWAVMGCELWQLHGLKAPDSVTQATQEYRQDSDTLATFLSECCDLSPEATVTKKDLYQRFSEWSKDSGERAISKNEFGTRLLERGFQDTRNGKVGRLWKGLGFQEVTQ